MRLAQLRKTISNPKKRIKRQQYYQQLTRYPSFFFFLENICGSHI
jgi:hypothetical protein